MNESRQALQHGTPVGDPFMAVGYVSTPTHGGCSGTLIAPRVVLTAAHCLLPYSSGCSKTSEWPADAAVTFAGQDGDRNNIHAQTIRIIGWAAHPDAIGDRIKRCPDYWNPALPCPTNDELEHMGVSCKLLADLEDRCHNGFAAFTMGLHFQHDIAVAYLAEAPVGIEPMPVVIGSDEQLGYVAPGMTTFHGLDSFFVAKPIVSIVGYGAGSPGRGRAFGTAQASLDSVSANEWLSCGPHAERVPVTASLMFIKPMEQRNAFLAQGDSGGPTFVGSVPVQANVTQPPTVVPVSSGLQPGPYVVGVTSRGGKWAKHEDLIPTGDAGAVPNGAKCTDPTATCPTTADCEPGKGTCNTWCDPAAPTGDPGSCPTGYVCFQDAAYGGHSDHCFRANGTVVPTFEKHNGAWLNKAVWDIDGDGIPNQIDNCPTIKNPGQENCNRDAEIDRGGDELGDACDPVPCPKAVMRETPPAVLEHHVSKCGSFGRIRVIHDKIDPEVLGSRNSVNGALVEQKNVQTEFRFCQKRVLGHITCKVEHGQRTDQQFDLADNPNSKWWRIDVDGLGVGGSTTYDYPSDPGIERWNYQGDGYRWSQQLHWLPGLNWHQGGSDSEWPYESGLHGVIGLRAGGSKSRDALGHAGGDNSGHDMALNGVHFTPDRHDGYREGEGLARHYIDDTLIPDKIVDTLINTCVSGHNPKELIPVRWCPMCARPQWWWLNPVDPVDGMLAKTPDGQWGLIDGQGGIRVGEGLLSDALRQRLDAPELRLIPAAEVFPAAGSSLQQVQGEFLSRDGTELAGEMIDTGNGLDIDSPFIGIIDAVEKRSPAGSAAPPIERTAVPGLPPRTNYHAVLSRTLGGLVIAGGKSTTTHRRTHDIWLVDPSGQPRSLHTPGYRPGKVLAMTVSSQDGAIWLLDQHRIHHWFREARLVRINPATGAHETVWKGPRIGLFDHHWLGLDKDGHVLLFASSRQLKQHVTVKFQSVPFVEGTAKPILMRWGVGELYGQPLVDRVGYQYVTRRVHHRRRLRVERVTDLHQGAAIVVDLSSCM